MPVMTFVESAGDVLVDLLHDVAGKNLPVLTHGLLSSYRRPQPYVAAFLCLMVCGHHLSLFE